MKKIRTLIVDDSIFFRTFLQEKLSRYPDIEIIGTAINAQDAKMKIPQLKPDVITLDVEMPGMSGIDFLKQLIPQHPIPVVLVSSLNIRVFDALSAGAVDFVRKPDVQNQDSISHFTEELASTISIASRAKIRPQAHGTDASSEHGPAARPAVPAVRPAASASSSPAPQKAAAGRAPEGPALVIPGGETPPLIALGASTGGTEATLTVLKNLPANTPGIVIVQHMPPGFTKMYADRLNRLCAMEVREAKTGDTVQPGLALIAPGDAQMRVVSVGKKFTVRCAPGPKVNGHCPSVDVLFHSVAKEAGAHAVGIIMTGMGQDGAEGLLAMRKAGAFTIGQDEASCVVYGMPMVAYNIGAVVKQASCDSIAYVLKTHLNQKTRP